MTKYVPPQDIEILEKLFETGNGDYKCGFNDGIEYNKIKSVSTIDEMIENLWGKGGYIPEIAKNSHKMEALQELKSRLLNNK